MYTSRTYSRYSVRAIRLLYFFLYVGMAAWSTQFYAFLECERSLTGVQIGLLAAVQQINNLIILPFWGMISDRYGKRKIFLILLALAAIMIEGFLCNGSFWFYLGFIIVFTTINNPLAALIDTFALEKSSQTVITSSYGSMRLCASLGWAVSSILTGMLIKNVNYSVIFPITTFFFVCAWIVAFTSLNKKHEQKTTKSPSIKTLVELLLENRRLLLFFVFCLIYYIFNAPIQNIINIYYSEVCTSYFGNLTGDELNQKIGMIVGLAFAVQSVSELPFMFYADKIIAYLGIRRVILFTMIVAALRMILYGFATNPYVAILIGCTHGITLGLFWVAAITYVHKLIPRGQYSTGQMLFNTFLAVGTCLGNLLTGYMKDFLTLQVGMKITAVAIFLLVIVGIVARKVFFQKNL